VALDIITRRRGYASGPIVLIWYPFVFIGAEPHTCWLDDCGYVLTGPDAARPAGKGAPQELGHEPYLLETSRHGVFAAGDVRSGSIKRVASAVGEGAMAVRFVHARR
jgi:thioredoxin reductase (NADPH)